MTQYEQQAIERTEKTWSGSRIGRAGFAGLLGGVLFVLYAIPDVLNQAMFSGESQLARIYSLVIVVPLALILLGVLGAHAYHKGSYGRLGTIGYGMSTIGLVMMVLAEFSGWIDPDLFFGIQDGWFILFVLSLFILVLGGGIPFGLAMRRAKKLPALGPTILAVALPVCVVGFAALESIGFDGTPFVAVTTVYGVAWAILGYHLWTRRVETPIDEAALQ